MLNFLTMAFISLMQANKQANDYSIDTSGLTSKQSNLFPMNFADTVFFNGTVLTMVKQTDSFSAIAIKGQTIIGVGNLESLKGFIDQKTRLINLNGLTLSPGFYDAHSHFSLNAAKMTQGFDLSSPPIGKVTKIADIIKNVKKYITDFNIPAGSTVSGMGYNDISLEDKRLITKQDLDQISTEHFILLLHSSGHIGSVNTKILQKQNITSQTRVPGGTVELDQKGQPNGILKQTALFTLGIPFFGKLTKQKVLAGQQQYFKAGFTTAQDVTTDGSEINAYLEAGNQLKIDIDAYQLCYPPSFKQYYEAKRHQMQHFKVKGIKMLFDGSIQAFTAALSEPYYVQPSAENTPILPIPAKLNRFKRIECTKKWCGCQTYADQSMINEYFQELKQNDIDSIVHCNGDVAIEQFIRAVKFARQSTANILNFQSFNFQKTRFILNHAQTATEAQLKQIKKLDIALSLFPAQTYFWGDVHRNIFLGPRRAARICPAKSALNNKIRFTLHSDAPVTPLSPYGVFQIIWSAVNRITLSGKVLGPDQRIPVYQALKAVTINAAWQGREDKTKGSIEVGKRADFLILSGNPLTVDALDLRSIKVVSTYKNGELVYDSREWVSQIGRMSLQNDFERLRQVGG